MTSGTARPGGPSWDGDRQRVQEEKSWVCTDQRFKWTGHGNRGERVSAQDPRITGLEDCGCHSAQLHTGGARSEPERAFVYSRLP